MSVKEPIIKNLFIVCLSNIIRKVSWQKDADLRVRKDVRLDAEIDPKKEFLEELGRTVRSILSFLYEHGPLINIDYSVSENDARNCGNIWGRDSVDFSYNISSICYCFTISRYRQAKFVFFGNVIKASTQKTRSKYDRE